MSAPIACMLLWLEMQSIATVFAVEMLYVTLLRFVGSQSWLWLRKLTCAR